MKRAILLFTFLTCGLFLFAQSQKMVKDIDGNLYSTVTIGTQIWMVQNLAVTKYNDGTPIPKGTFDRQWKKANTGLYGYILTPAVGHADEYYGLLYNWFAINTKKLCPIGWHVPTEAEWRILSEFLGGNTVAGGKMKFDGNMSKINLNVNLYIAEEELNIWNWKSNAGSTNEVGFQALPGAWIQENGRRQVIGYNAYFWSSTESDDINAVGRSLSVFSSSLSTISFDKRAGFSVRCIKD